MLSVGKTIKKNKLFNEGDIVGVAVSGGVDSLSLLHFLNVNKEIYSIEVVAINIDHQMRENSNKDSLFVKKFCKENNIKFNKFKVNALEIAKEGKLTKEEGARVARYGVFDSLIKKNIVNKICLGHHISDQAETVLLNLFRGTGLNGARGMELVRDSYIRPMLLTKKIEILNYAKKNNLKHVTDESNSENEFSRNYLRNVVMPLINARFKGAEKNLANFSSVVKQDDDYIKKMMNIDAIIKEDYLVKIPVSYFLYPEPIVSRMLLYCFTYLGVQKDIEKKHLKIIKNMVRDAVNGIKINLPNKINVHKEYDYITIIAKSKKYSFESRRLKSGTFTISNFGKISIKRTYNVDSAAKDHVVDVKKVPAKAIWRKRKDGDVFTKFGGGTKKLNEYLIDKKVPNRLRDAIPVLALDKEVYIVAGYDISEKVKIDPNSKSAYIIKYNLKL
jgi:tRNA(Ile)-lysidine synthase